MRRFNLEVAIAAWRRPYEHNDALTSDDLEELEGSLRDRVEAFQRDGLTEEQAFRKAVDRVGAFGATDAEYRKVYWGKMKREGSLRHELRIRIDLLMSYLVIGYRNLRRQPGYTMINVVGLSVGLACFLLIALYVRYEYSFDRFHTKADRIVRIASEQPGNDYLGTNQYAVTPAPLVATLQESFPEVEAAVQLQPVEVLFRNESTQLYEAGLLATAQFFDVFSFELMAGQPADVLSRPGTVVLTETMARTYFGDADPLGATLDVRYQGTPLPLTVTGLVADPPANSHIQFDYLVSMTTDPEYRRLLDGNEWDSNNYRTYVALHHAWAVPDFEDELARLAAAQLGELTYYQENPERIARYFAQPLTSIHLHSDINFELGPNGNLTYVYLFGAIGLLILLIACINYMNLATARSVVRAKEVGVRKIMGAYRSQLVGQFLGEALVLCSLATVLAVALAAIALPAVNGLTGRAMIMAFEAPSLAAVLGIALLVGLLSGIYPAFVSTRSKPIIMMQGGLRRTRGKAFLRNVLVTGQFAVTALLLIGTLVIYQQLHFIQTAQTGLDREQVLTIPLESETARKQFVALSEEMAAHPGVVSVSATRFNPSYIAGQTTLEEWEGVSEGQRLAVHQSPAQPGFVDVLGIDLVAGRDMRSDRAEGAPVEVLVNQTFAEALGWDAPLGKVFSMMGWNAQVVGVMADFNFLPFRQDMAPLVVYPSRWFTQALVKIGPQDIPASLAHLEATMATFAPEEPFVYQFLDEAFNSQYQNDARLGTLLRYLTGLALLISCLGLLGLATFIATQRTKEIGIRKAMGASTGQIVLLLTKDFTRLVCLAFVLGAPLAWLASTAWLQDFAYRIDLSPFTFALTGLALLGLAFVTVSHQALRAAWTNPVDTLRYE